MKDALVPREDLLESFDKILIDAPCSGIGVMWEKPDVKYRHNLESISSLVEEQRNILEVCSKYVKPGGVLVYSTCSILQKENQQQVAHFLENHDDFAMVSFPQNFPEKLAKKTTELGLQLLPTEDEVEGFFIARLMKKGKTR